MTLPQFLTVILTFSAAEGAMCLPKGPGMLDAEPWQMGLIAVTSGVAIGSWQWAGLV